MLLDKQLYSFSSIRENPIDEYSSFNYKLVVDGEAGYSENKYSYNSGCVFGYDFVNYSNYNSYQYGVGHHNRLHIAYAPRETILIRGSGGQGVTPYSTYYIESYFTPSAPYQALSYYNPGSSQDTVPDPGWNARASPRSDMGVRAATSPLVRVSADRGHALHARSGPVIADQHRLPGVQASRNRCPSRVAIAHAAWMKLSSTILRPALSKSTVSLLPSTAATVPWPNFWWNTRAPLREGRRRRVDLATSSPSICTARAAQAAARAGAVAPAAPLPLRALPARRRVGRAEAVHVGRSARRHSRRSASPGRPRSPRHAPRAVRRGSATGSWSATGRGCAGWWRSRCLARRLARVMPDIGEPPLLLEAGAAVLVERALVREQAFLPAGQEHGVELEPLGAVQRHDGDALAAPRRRRRPSPARCVRGRPRGLGTPPSSGRVP